MLSQEQIIDAAGGFAAAAHTAIGQGAAEFDPSRVPSPFYAEVAAVYGVNEQQSNFVISDSPQQRMQLARFPGLRVSVSKVVHMRAGGSRVVYFPGIVLKTALGQSPNVGTLEAGPDALIDGDALIKHQDRPLSDLQQTMLSRLYGLETPEAGQHYPDGLPNVGESAHGALIAVTNPADITNLHRRVHQYIPRGLAQVISQAPQGSAGAIDLETSKGLRPVRDNVISALAPTLIAVSEKHQLPPNQGLGIGLGQLVVGTTLAAVRSKARSGFPQPDLLAGMAAVIGGR